MITKPFSKGSWALAYRCWNSGMEKEEALAKGVSIHQWDHLEKTYGCGCVPVKLIVRAS